jgi:ParB family chromosome partitioning protein
MSKTAIQAQRGDEFRIRPEDPNVDVRVIDNPNHPEYDDRVLQPADPDLVWSLRNSGMLQAARGYKNGLADDGREIVTLTLGRRRWKAIQEVWRQMSEEGLSEKDFPAFRLTLSQYGNGARKLEDAIIENVHREDLTPVQKAQRLSHYLAVVGDDKTTRERALSVFRIKSQVALDNLLSLLDATPAVQQAVAEGKISATLAMHVSKIDPEKQDQFVEAVNEATKPFSVSEGREKIADLNGTKAPAAFPARKVVEKRLEKEETRLEKAKDRLLSREWGFTKEHEIHVEIAEQQGFVRALHWILEGGAQ